MRDPRRNPKRWDELLRAGRKIIVQGCKEGVVYFLEHQSDEDHHLSRPKNLMAYNSQWRKAMKDAEVLNVA